MNKIHEFFNINKNNLVKFMSKIRKKHGKEFKFKVAIEALKEQKTITTICREFSICESQVNAWKEAVKRKRIFCF